MFIRLYHSWSAQLGGGGDRDLILVRFKFTAAVPWPRKQSDFFQSRLGEYAYEAIITQHNFHTTIKGKSICLKDSDFRINRIWGKKWVDYNKNLLRGILPGDKWNMFFIIYLRRHVSKGGRINKQKARVDGRLVGEINGE